MIIRILFITPYIPSQVRTRAYNFLRRLARQHQVTILGLQHTRQEANDAASLRAEGFRVEIVRQPRWRAYQNCLLALPGPMPLQVAYCYSPQLIATLSGLLSQDCFDVVHLNLIRSAYLAPRLNGYPVILDLADSRVSYQQQVLSRARNPFSKLLAWEELIKLRRYEPEVSHSAQAVLMNSDSDREELLRLDPELNVQVLRTGVDLEHFAYREPETCPPRLVFVGRLGYYPNERAVLWFCREMLPLVRQALPHLRLTVVGDRPSPAVQALMADPGIEVTGYVDDIRPYLWSATVSIAPLDIATGVQLKVTQAMAAGVPVVATRVANRGVGGRHDEHLLIADTPQTFVEQLKRLLADVSLRRRLARQARAYVEVNFSWETNTARLEALYAAAIEACAYSTTARRVFSAASQRYEQVNR